MHAAQELPETIFDKILSHEIPADVVYEDEYTFAFLDIHPNHIGHTLVIPKKRVRNIFDLDPETLKHLMTTVQKLSIAVKKGVHADGINIAMNNGPAAGQVVFHAHIHIIPRFTNDGFVFFPHTEYKPGEAAEVAEKIRTQLSREKS
jgi:histidine triad (HIT) family protein